MEGGGQEKGAAVVLPLPETPKQSLAELLPPLPQALLVLAVSLKNKAAAVAAAGGAIMEFLA